jgi:MFS family permease
MSLFGTTLSPIELGGWAIGLVGLFNIIGSLLWGWLGGQFSARTCWRCSICCAR